MLGYYLELAARSFRRDLALTLLMVLAIGIGIGACMTALTVYHVLNLDPHPGRSDKLYRVQLDPRRAADRNWLDKGGEPYELVSWTDGANLLRAARARRQTLTTSAGFRLETPDGRAEPVHPYSLFATADFFPMFGLPFAYGQGWSAADDAAGARVMVITDELNRRYFDGKDSVGQSLLVNNLAFRIVGVLAPWRALPRVYSTFGPADFSDTYDAYLPLAGALAAGLGRAGNWECWGTRGALARGEALKSVPCAWLAMWVQLDDAAAAARYRDFLVSYSQEQRALGRFERAPNVRLRSLPEWLAFNQVVPSDVRLQAWLAFGFLLVCLVNATGLLLAKFMRRFGELGVRRALGATRGEVFAQLLVEAGLVGLAGGVLGLGLAGAGLWLVRRQRSNEVDFASLAHLDLSMLAATFVLALLASVAIGLLPAWRACRVAPALQLKTA